MTTKDVDPPRYIALLIGLAFWLERQGIIFGGQEIAAEHLCLSLCRSGPVYKQFINLLWVLAGWFVFIAGAYIAAPC